MTSINNYNYTLLIRGLNDRDVSRSINKYLRLYFNCPGFINNHIDPGHLSELAEDMGKNPDRYIPLFNLLEPYHEQS